jgi:hypothetical protein
MVQSCAALYERFAGHLRRGLAGVGDDSVLEGVRVHCAAPQARSDHQLGRESGSAVSYRDVHISDVQQCDLESEDGFKRVAQTLKSRRPVLGGRCAEESIPILMIGGDSQPCRPGHLGVPEPVLQLSVQSPSIGIDDGACIAGPE